MELAGGQSAKKCYVGKQERKIHQQYHPGVTPMYYKQDMPANIARAWMFQK